MVEVLHFTDVYEVNEKIILNNNNNNNNNELYLYSV